ncbi:hypothetical protein ACQKL5_04310 [Peribacillus sp. NPDC097675]|uniref:hypothetical protein n=1 Tax=Peribacillus sp. NPDC097675 TaxID=3390618 RepID=UPI003CFDA63F
MTTITNITIITIITTTIITITTVTITITTTVVAGEIVAISFLLGAVTATLEETTADATVGNAY